MTSLTGETGGQGVGTKLITGRISVWRSSLCGGKQMQINKETGTSLKDLGQGLAVYAGRMRKGLGHFQKVVREDSGGGREDYKPEFGKKEATELSTEK